MSHARCADKGDSVNSPKARWSRDHRAWAADASASAAAEPRFDAPAAIAFTVTSDIPECLETVGKRTHADANLLLGEVVLKTTAMTARCGCISKWLLYRSVTSTDELETEFASGSLLAAEPGTAPIERQVVLLGDRGHAPTLPIIVHVRCAPAP